MRQNNYGFLYLSIGEALNIFHALIDNVIQALETNSDMNAFRLVRSLKFKLWESPLGDIAKDAVFVHKLLEVRDLCGNSKHMTKIEINKILDLLRRELNNDT
jgi:hypothetical protein